MGITTIDTASVAERDRLDFWRSTVCDQFVTLDVRPAAGSEVQGRVTAVSMADTQLRKISAGAHRFERTTRQVRTADEDYLQIALARKGRTVLDDRPERVVRLTMGHHDDVLCHRRSRQRHQRRDRGRSCISVHVHPSLWVVVATGRDGPAVGPACSPAGCRGAALPLLRRRRPYSRQPGTGTVRPVRADSVAASAMASAAMPSASVTGTGAPSRQAARNASHSAA